MKNVREEGGFVFITVITFAALLFGIALSYVDLLVAERKFDMSSVNSQRAEALAEAGLEEAFWEYNYGGADFSLLDNWSIAPTALDRRKTVTGFTDASGNVVGNYTVTVTDYQGSNPLIESTAALTGRGGTALTATLKAQLRPRPDYSNAISANGTVHFDSNAGTDSFDSNDGVYGGSNVGESGDVVTNDTSAPAITLDSNAEIAGDAGGGAASGGMTSSDQTQVTGTYTDGSSVTIPNNDVKYAATITVLSLLPDSGTMSGDTTLTTSARYRNIDMNSNRTITVDGNVSLYLWDTATAIQMDSNVDIVINPGASLTIYSAGDVALDSNVDVNANGGTDEVSRFQLIGLSTCDSVQIDSNVNIVGTVSTPQANIQLDSNVNVYGAMVGNNFDINSNSYVHYDEDLADEGTGTGTRLQWMRRSA